MIIVVPDPDALYRSWADGPGAAYGTLPVAGIPRLVRPRKRWGTVYGFSLVDVGGNPLCVSLIGDSEDETEESAPGLARILDVAARLADAHGDDAAAMRTLASGLAREADAPPITRAHALLYRAELAIRLTTRPSPDDAGRGRWPRPDRK